MPNETDPFRTPECRKEFHPRGHETPGFQKYRYYPSGIRYLHCRFSRKWLQDPLGFTFIGNKQKLINDLLEVRFLLEPSIAAMAATHADENDIKKITALCDEVEAIIKKS